MPSGRSIGPTNLYIFPFSLSFVCMGVFVLFVVVFSEFVFRYTMSSACCWSA